MIETVADNCIRCDICERICPTRVFDRDETGRPVIARQSDCQTCYLCEIWCPVDALYVAPYPDGPSPENAALAGERGLYGSYARALGWRKGRAGGTENDPTQHIRVAQV